MGWSLILSRFFIQEFRNRGEGILSWFQRSRVKGKVGLYCSIPEGGEYHVRIGKGLSVPSNLFKGKRYITNFLMGKQQKCLQSEGGESIVTGKLSECEIKA